MFYFHPEPWGNDFNLTNSYFSDGWFNHQLDYVGVFLVGILKKCSW